MLVRLFEYICTLDGYKGVENIVTASADCQDWRNWLAKSVVMTFDE